MSDGGGTIASDLIAQANAARQAGRRDEALALLSDVVRRHPDLPAAWNSLGLVQLELAQAEPAAASFESAIRLDPRQPVLLFNLARALHAASRFEDELATLDRVLALDSYFLPALLAKGRVLKRLGRSPEAVRLLRAVLSGISDVSIFPPAIQAELAQARRLVADDDALRQDAFTAILDDVRSAHPDADLTRAEAFVAVRAGQRKVFVQQPVDAHFPYLPAIEYFDRALFPWFEAFEAQTAAIRSELLALWQADDEGFRPYVAYEPGTPVNQWGELNHSPRWSAWFLWENGTRNNANCERCPATAAIAEGLPLLDLPGKGPTVMFSVLKPRTRIPPHTGSTNARVTVHLPLVVPGQCGFRVGAETREWKEGVAWAFDDTIEHEAWNDSDSPRAILIVDTWNPLLSEAERSLVRRIG